MRRKTEPRVALHTVRRRTVLEWLGSGCVLTLGGAALAACGVDPGTGVDRGFGAGDAGPSPDNGSTGDLALSGDGQLLDGPGAGGFPFKPGDGKHSIYGAWGIRTVDPQSMDKILATWKLSVDGMVTTKASFNFAELVALSRQDQVTDFHCVEGWSVLDVPWNGVHLDQIIKIVKPTAKATYVSFHTVGGSYNESLPLAVAREKRSLLAYGVGGSTLTAAHGFPLRVVVPRLLGYKNAKYVTRIEFTDKPLYGFWVKAGYGYEGKVPAKRLRPGKY